MAIHLLSRAAARCLNKQIAITRGASAQTIKVLRMHITEKLEIHSLGERVSPRSDSTMA